MKKIELKLSYFADLERINHFEKQQIKSSEAEVIREKLELAIKLTELQNITKEINQYSEIMKLNQGDVRNERNDVGGEYVTNKNNVGSSAEDGDIMQLD